AAESSVSGRGSIGGASEGSKDRDARIAETPTTAFVAAATKNVDRMPSRGMKYRPAASVPTIAPAVLLPYNAATCAPSVPSRTPDDLITSGSVAPIIMVGTINPPNAIAKRTPVSAVSDCDSEG